MVIADGGCGCWLTGVRSGRQTCVLPVAVACAWCRWIVMDGGDGGCGVADGGRGYLGVVWRCGDLVSVGDGGWVWGGWCLQCGTAMSDRVDAV